MKTRRVVIGFVFSTLPLLAQEGSGAGGSSGEKPDMFIWTFLNFLIIAGFIGWLVKKHGVPFLAARSGEIKAGLAAGEKAKAQADARSAEVKKQLANLDQEVSVMRANAKEEREREADRIRREAQSEMARVRAQAEQEIESSGKMARLEVQRAAAKLAIELAETKVRARMSPEIQRALLQGFLADLAGNRESRVATNVE
jgi:F-type H+-transporting ATPase subunit b